MYSAFARLAFATTTPEAGTLTRDIGLPVDTPNSLKSWCWGWGWSYL